MNWTNTMSSVCQSRGGVYFLYNGIRGCATGLGMIFVTFGIASGKRPFGIILGYKTAKFGIDLGPTLTR